MTTSDTITALRAALERERQQRETAERAADGLPAVELALQRALRDRDARTSPSIEALQDRIEQAADAHDRRMDGLLRAAVNMGRLVTRAPRGVLTAAERADGVRAVADAIAALNAAGIAHSLTPVGSDG